jgi:hypothetical protein
MAMKKSIRRRESLLAVRPAILKAPTTMKKTFLSICALATLLVLPSCIESETTINLNKDGSGTLVVETMMGAQALAMMGGLGEAGEGAPDPTADLVSEEKARGAGAKLGEGVTFEKVEAVERNGARGGRATYKFADINKLKLDPNSALAAMGDQEEGAEAEAPKPITFAYAGGKLTVTQPGEVNEEGGMFDMSDFPEDDPAADPQQKAMMEMMLGDMRIAIKINIVPGIKETNATHREGNVITLTEVKFGELIKNEEAMKKMRTLGGKTEEEAKAVLKEIPGIKVEMNKELVVELE